MFFLFRRIHTIRLFLLLLLLPDSYDQKSIFFCEKQSESFRQQHWHVFSLDEKKNVEKTQTVDFEKPTHIELNVHQIFAGFSIVCMDKRSKGVLFFLFENFNLAYR